MKNISIKNNVKKGKNVKLKKIISVHRTLSAVKTENFAKMARFRLNFAKISSGKCPIPYDTFKIFRALSVSGEQFIVIFLKTLQKMIRFK